MTAIGVIGLGAMGGRIASRLLDAGHQVVVWNRTSAKMAPLVELGAIPAESPGEVADRANAVLTMMSDPGALRAVTEGPGGIAAAAQSSLTLIEMSTVGPATLSWLESALPSDIGLLDAPVLGSTSEVEAGSLRVFVGGPGPLVARWMPLLSVLGSPLHVGPLGAGAAAKLVANSTLLGVLGLLGEAVALANGLGLSGNTTFEVLSATPLSTQAERRRDAIESGDYPARFSLSLARKDANLIVDAATATGVHLRLAAAARDWIAEADEAGWGNHDYSALLAWILQAHRP